MKTRIEIPFAAFEPPYRDDGLGELLAKSKFRYATIFPIHAREVMVYTLVGDYEVVKPVQAKLMSIVLQHELQVKNGNRRSTS